MRNPSRLLCVLGLPGIFALAACQESPSDHTPAQIRSSRREVDAIPPERRAAGQLLYAPAYSWVDTADRAEPFQLAITLVIRNLDPRNPVVISRVDYHDQDGKQVKSYLKRPFALDPLASTTFFVKESDTTAGMLPSFLVEWAADQPVRQPIVETFMIGTAAMQGVSLRCPAQVLTDFGAQPSAPQRPAS